MEKEKRLLEALKNYLARFDENEPPKAKRGDRESFWKRSVYIRDRENTRRLIAEFEIKKESC